MQPYLFPYVGYFQLMNYVDTYVVYDDVQFIKGGWINRNYILLKQEQRMLTLPLERAGPNKKICEINVAKYHKKYLKTIAQAYRPARYFNDVYPIVEKIFTLQDMNLVSLIMNSFDALSEYLGIRAQLVLSSSLKIPDVLKGESRVLEICRKIGAQTYINAIGGQALYSREVFRDNGIALKFMSMRHIMYEQYWNKFVPNLSIIDALMFNSRQQLKTMLAKFELV